MIIERNAEPNSNAKAGSWQDRRQNNFQQHLMSGYLHRPPSADDIGVMLSSEDRPPFKCGSCSSSQVVATFQKSIQWEQDNPHTSKASL